MVKRVRDPEYMRAQSNASYERHKEKNQARGREQYQRLKSAEYNKRTNLRRYKMTLEQYTELFEKQEGRCDICRTEILHTTTADNKNLSAYVDHNHQTGAVRGLLCNYCNRGLGLFRDNPEHLRSAVQYLERN